MLFFPVTFLSIPSFVNTLFSLWAAKVLVINYLSISPLSSMQRKLVSDSLGPMDFATGLVISILNLPDGQTKYFEGIQITEEL